MGERKEISALYFDFQENMTSYCGKKIDWTTQFNFIIFDYMKRPIKNEFRVVHQSVNDYYYCPRCEIDSLNSDGRYCPCPRGSCEAEIIGEAILEDFQTILIDDIKSGGK